MAKNNPASPRVVRRGTARPAEKSFHSASLETKHRNSTTIRRAGQSRIAFRSVPRDADDCNSTVPSCIFLPEHTESGFAGHRRRLGKDAVPALQPQPCHRGRAPSRPLAAPHVHFTHRSGIGPAHDVPAPPSARGVRTWEGRNLLRPSGRQAHPQHEEYPNLRPVNTERAEVRRHGGFLELAYAHLNHAACNLHGLGCDKRSPPVSSQNSTDSPIYGWARLSRPQSRWFCKCLCMVKRGRIVRSTFFPGLFCVARRAFLCILW